MAASETDGADLHKEFCTFLLERLREKDDAGKPLCSASWGNVIRTFLKDNSIVTVPDDDAQTPLGELSKAFTNSRPPRGGGLNPALDLDPDEVH
jgi:hypothetical protein